MEIKVKKASKPNGVILWEGPSLAMLHKIVGIAQATPMVAHWLPTKEYGIVNAYLAGLGSIRVPRNLTIRVSAPAIEATMRSYHEPGIVNSAVSLDPARVTCPAYSQGGVCGSCRACWDSNIETVTYPAH